MPVHGVPKDQVGQVVQDFIDDGEDTVGAKREGSGDTYTVTERSAGPRPGNKKPRGSGGGGGGGRKRGTR